MPTTKLMRRTDRGKANHRPKKVNAIITIVTMTWSTTVIIPISNNVLLYRT